MPRVTTIDTDINKISEDEKMVLYKAADEYQTTGIINAACPRCNGKFYGDILLNK